MISTDPSQLFFAFCGYFLCVGIIGFVAFRTTTDVAGFLLGGRRLSRRVTALSAGASDMSGWLLLGLPGLAYVSLFESIWVAVGLTLGTYLNWLFIAKPLREQTERYDNALTIPEYLQRRFNDPTHLLRAVAALSMVLFFIFYTVAGFVAGGKLFAAAFAIDYSHAVILCATLVATYASFGGFKAVAWTDAFQAGLMLFALLLVAALAINATGVSLVAEFAVSDDPFNSTPAIVVVSSLAWGLGYFGQPHILTRFMAITNSEDLVGSRKFAMRWTVLGLICAITLGHLGTRVLGSALPADESEKVFIYLTQQLLYPGLAGVCLAGILAAIMSTADSQILVASAALTHDLLGKVLTGQANKLYWHRVTVALVCGVAAAMAIGPGQLVFSIVAYAWAGFGASLGPCIIMSLYSTNTSRWGALTGIIVGAVCVVIWESQDGGIFDVYSLLPGFCLSFASIALVNRCFPFQPVRTDT